MAPASSETLTLAPAPFTRVQPALALAASRPDTDLRLAVLAAHAGLSAFHLHRLLSAVAGETPKAYTLRLRLGHGAARLLTGAAVGARRRAVVRASTATKRSRGRSGGSSA